MCSKALFIPFAHHQTSHDASSQQTHGTGTRTGGMKSGWHGELGCGTSTSVEWYERPYFEFSMMDHSCAFLQYSPYLRGFVTTLTAVSFASLETSGDDGAVLMKRIWRMATCQE